MPRPNRAVEDVELGSTIISVLKRQDMSITGLMQVTNGSNSWVTHLVLQLHREKKIHINDWTIVNRPERIWTWGPGKDAAKPKIRELLPAEKPKADVAASWLFNPLPAPQGRIRVRPNGTKVYKVEDEHIPSP